MQKLLSTIIAGFILLGSFGQSTEELNGKAKEFLAKRDYKNAVLLIKQAAEQGNPEAQYNFGVCYQQGIEVPLSDSLANDWFLKSAKQGWKDAQYKVAYSYARGRGWEKNDKQAFFWSLRCAEQEDPECMFNVANCYFVGEGTDKNLDSMLAWTMRLALLENPDDLQLSGHITSARANLAIMYQNGNNVKKDLVKGYMWFLIYNENKRDFSILVQQENIESIKVIEQQLTESDKEKARFEAEKLINKKLANLANLHNQDL